MPFQRAVKAEAKLRLGIAGPSGSGKTFTALKIAARLAEAEGKRVALIDSERGSASKYADEFDFDTLWLASFHPQQYVAAIKEAHDGDHSVLIIDTLSHAWAGTDGALELADKARVRYGDNRWAAWADVTPLHNELLDAIAQAGMHVIVTFRAKTEWVLDDKNKPRKVGMAPIQRDGIDYEFDAFALMDREHSFVIDKSRCPALDNAIIPLPDEGVADTLLAWLSGEPPENQPTPQKPAGEPAIPRKQQPETPVGTPVSGGKGRSADGLRRSARERFDKLAGIWGDRELVLNMIEREMKTVLSLVSRDGQRIREVAYGRMGVDALKALCDLLQRHIDANTPPEQPEQPPTEEPAPSAEAQGAEQGRLGGEE